MPVILLVLAATVIPVELRWPAYEAAGFRVSANLVFDVLANILGYVPVGIVLRDLGPVRAVATAAAVAGFAETAQLAMVHRDASVVDVLANVVGATLGVAIASHWKLRPPALVVSKGKSQIAALAAAMIVVDVWATSPDEPGSRGVTSPGRLEAHWKLDERTGRAVADSSGHGLDGRFSKEPVRVDGVTGRAVLFDGATHYVDFGYPTALRLAGSMTVSAWIKSTFYPFDDAAIVSSHTSDAAGYQLDTTVDRGARTVGFKIADECGRLAIRYGATPLLAGAWYHIAGVYDSEARTLSVYLNGELDNGFLFGSVTGTQRSSRSRVYVGRRSDLAGYEFAGFIRDVRIYSRALKAAEVVSAMRAHVTDPLAPRREAGENAESRRTPNPDDRVRAPCAISSDDEDKYVPIAAAAVGLLVAVAGVGLRPRSGGLLWLVVSLAAGIALPVSTLPAINLWLVPLTSLAGGASVVFSIRRAA